MLKHQLLHRSSRRIYFIKPLLKKIIPAHILKKVNPHDKRVISVKKINNTSITFGEIDIYLKAEQN